MDIVTAGRACARRWYLVIPILIIGILASVHVANATKPTYQSTGQFIVLGSAVQPVTVKTVPTAASKTPVVRVTVTKEKNGTTTTPSPAPTPTAAPTPTPKPVPVPTVTQNNPYANSADLLRAALLDDLNGEPFATTIANSGVGGSFNVVITKKEPVFEVTAQARHRKTALALANAVLQNANAQLATVQTSAGAPPRYLQRVQVLTPGTTPTNITSGKSKRLVAGVVITVAAAIALSIGLDSLILVLRRRRDAGDAADTAAAANGYGSTGPLNTTVLPAQDAGQDPVAGPTPDDPPTGGGWRSRRPKD